MNKELKKRWVAALRSGEYQQTREYLQDEIGYCCLGVLCDLVDSNKWSVVDNEDYPIYISYCFDNYITDREFPDHNWLKNIGLDPDTARYLASQNDEGASFKEIADYIQENIDEKD